MEKKGEIKGIEGVVADIVKTSEKYETAIETALGKLVDAGYVKVGNYNDTSFDRTKWYAITELGIKAMEE